jgi:hypothetical protein
VSRLLAIAGEGGAREFVLRAQKFSHQTSVTRLAHSHRQIPSIHINEFPTPTTCHGGQALLSGWLVGSYFIKQYRHEF